MEPVVLDTLDPLIDALRERGYAVVGPAARDGVIRFTELDFAADLPVGRTDEQAPGAYRLHERGELVFGFATSPDSVKRYTHPPRSTLFRMRDGVPQKPPVEVRKAALLGVRACDLAALAVQDRVFLGGRYPDEAYRERRAALFLIAVNCAVPGGTCFCASSPPGSTSSAPTAASAADGASRGARPASTSPKNWSGCDDPRAVPCPLAPP